MLDLLNRWVFDRSESHEPVIFVFHSVCKGAQRPKWPWALSLAGFLEQLAFLFRHPLDVMISIEWRYWMGLHVGESALAYCARRWLNKASQMRKAGFQLLVHYVDLIKDPGERENVLKSCSFENSPPEKFVSESKVDLHAHDAQNRALKEHFYLMDLVT